MLNQLFNWIRRGVAQAVVNGIGDGLQAVSGREIDTGEALKRIGHQPEEEATPQRNGRRKKRTAATK